MKSVEYEDTILTLWVANSLTGSPTGYQSHKETDWLVNEICKQCIANIAGSIVIDYIQKFIEISNHILRTFVDEFFREVCSQHTE